MQRLYVLTILFSQTVFVGWCVLLVEMFLWGRNVFPVETLHATSLRRNDFVWSKRFRWMMRFVGRNVFVGWIVSVGLMRFCWLKRFCGVDAFCWLNRFLWGRNIFPVETLHATSLHATSLHAIYSVLYEPPVSFKISCIGILKLIESEIRRLPLNS